MFGYAPNGYRLWDMASEKVLTSRDVKFDESTFPMKNLKDTLKPLIISTHEQYGEIKMIYSWVKMRSS